MDDLIRWLIVACVACYIVGVFAIRIERPRTLPMLTKAGGAFSWAFSPIWVPFWCIGKLLFWDQPE